jgi:hypothetical protein
LAAAAPSGRAWPACPDEPAIDAATLGYTSTSRSTPVIDSTRCTAGVLTTSRTALAGGGTPEYADQSAHSGRIAEIRLAHVRDQQYRALVQHGEEFLLEGLGIGHVNLRGQRDHGYLADP